MTDRKHLGQQWNREWFLSTRSNMPFSRRRNFLCPLFKVCLFWKLTIFPFHYHTTRQCDLITLYLMYFFRNVPKEKQPINHFTVLQDGQFAALNDVRQFSTKKSQFWPFSLGKQSKFHKIGGFASKKLSKFVEIQRSIFICCKLTIL